MANPKHVALVRKGSAAILEWRRAHFTARRLDLRGADLRGAELSNASLGGTSSSSMVLGEHKGGFATVAIPGVTGADLSRANLSRADLTQASLNDCSLREADLRNAALSRADLMTADLTSANLTACILRDADLRWADLSDAKLALADLRHAKLMGGRLALTDLDGADLSYAYFGLGYVSAVDLSQVVGLETITHGGPSSIDLYTLIGSVRGAGNKLTRELHTFFLGAGVPSELLDALPDIVREVKHYSCFISYGQHDLKFAKKLTEDLRAKGVSCWLWETDKTVGQRTQHEIEEKLEEYEKIVVLCSIHSLLGNGIRREIDRQLAKAPDKLVPVSLEEGWKHDNYKVDCLGTDLKPFLVDRNYADFANKPYDEALAELLKGLRRP